MIVSMGTVDWQRLRALVRAEVKKVYPTGRELRIDMSRRSQDGTFLDRLVELGLIAVVVKPPPPPHRESEPAQFRARYKITNLGRHAAEYGEYDRPFIPKVGEVTGLAAQLLVTNNAPEKPARKKGRK